ncbi:hypothetical protein [Clostridium butyricum]
MVKGIALLRIRLFMHFSVQAPAGTRTFTDFASNLLKQNHQKES